MRCVYTSCLRDSTRRVRSPSRTGQGRGDFSSRPTRFAAIARRRRFVRAPRRPCAPRAPNARRPKSSSETSSAVCDFVVTLRHFRRHGRVVTACYAKTTSAKKPPRSVSIACKLLYGPSATPRRDIYRTGAESRAATAGWANRATPCPLGPTK